MWLSTIQTGSSLCSFNSLWSRQFTAPSFIVPRCCDIAAVLRRHSKLNTLLRLSLLTFKSLGREAGLYFCLSLSSKDYKVRGAHIKQQSNPWCALRRATLDTWSAQGKHGIHCVELLTDSRIKEPGCKIHRDLVAEKGKANTYFCIWL